MKVSIITVSFNSAATIRDTIISVIEQGHDDIEHIIIDGGSTDKTMEIVRQYESSIAVLISEPDQGIYDAMNKGIKAATGEVVGILNSDDVFACPDVIENVVSTFGRDKFAEIVFGDVVFVSPSDQGAVTRYYSSRSFRRWKLRFGFMPPHPATFVRKRLYEQSGYYSLDYQISSDYEMFVRWLYIAKLEYLRIDKVLVKMRPGGASTSGIQSSIQLNREIIKACTSNGLYTNWIFLCLKIPFKLFEYVRKPTQENE